jgi:hypothetical protein
MADFGSSVAKQVARNTFCGTYEYMAPEIYMREKQTDKVDIWALGILLFEMSHNVTPFKDKNIYEIRDMIEGGFLPFDPQISLRIRQIIWKILRIDPRKRPTAKDILMFPEFNMIHHELKHLISKNNLVDRLNFDVMKGRILTLEEPSTKKMAKMENNSLMHKMSKLKEKARINNQLMEFQKKFKLFEENQNDDSKEKVEKMSNLEYDFSTSYVGPEEEGKKVKIDIYENCRNESTQKMSENIPNLNSIHKKNTLKHKKKLNLSRFGKKYKGKHIGIYKHHKKASKNITYLNKKRQKVLKNKKKMNFTDIHGSFTHKSSKKNLTNYSMKLKNSKFSHNFKTPMSIRNLQKKLQLNINKTYKPTRIKNQKKSAEKNKIKKNGRIESLNVLNNKSAFYMSHKIMSLEQKNSISKNGKRHIFTKNDFLKKLGGLTKNNNLNKIKENSKNDSQSEYYDYEDSPKHSLKHFPKNKIDKKPKPSKFKDFKINSLKTLDTTKSNLFGSSRKSKIKPFKLESKKKVRYSAKNYTGSKVKTQKVDEYDFSFTASHRAIKNDAKKPSQKQNSKKDSTHDSESRGSANRDYERRMGDLRKGIRKSKNGGGFFGKFLERSCEFHRTKSGS